MLEQPDQVQSLSNKLAAQETKKSALPGQPWNTHLAKVVTMRVSQSQGPWEVSSQGLGAGARHQHGKRLGQWVW